MAKTIRVMHRGYFGVYGSNRVCLLASGVDYNVHRETERGDIIVDAVCINSGDSVRAVVEKCNITQISKYLLRYHKLIFQQIGKKEHKNMVFPQYKNYMIILLMILFTMKW